MNELLSNKTLRKTLWRLNNLDPSVVWKRVVRYTEILCHHVRIYASRLKIIRITTECK